SASALRRSATARIYSPSIARSS
ncbi:putative oligopeptide ABC transporter, ATP-binding protein AppF, partial [Chlamydia psittaci 06-1683]